MKGKQAPTYLEVPYEVDTDVLLAVGEVGDPARHLLRVARAVVGLEGGDEALVPEVAGHLLKRRREGGVGVWMCKGGRWLVG